MMLIGTLRNGDGSFFIFTLHEILEKNKAKGFKVLNIIEVLKYLFIYNQF